jgi:putative methylase
VRRSELVRALERVPGFSRPSAAREQVVTPSEAAATLLEAAERFEGLPGRSVVDLGCGTGRLAIGAALLGARPVTGIDSDPAAIAQARAAAAAAAVEVEFLEGEAGRVRRRAELFVMNPPFGAQHRHADRPFWDRALALADRAVFAFALAASRTFIAQRAVEHAARVVAVEPVPWTLPRTFPHHVRSRVPLAVDLWAIRTREDR